MNVANVMALAWDLGTFLQNATSTLKTWGNYLIILIGVVMIIVAVYQIAKGLISHGRGQPTNWFVAILLLIIGGALMVGGFTWVSGIAEGGKQTIDDLGNGSGSGGIILPLLRFIK